MSKKKPALSKKEFSDIIRNGRKIQGQNILLFYKKAEVTKVGIAVSKTIKTATRRNRVKRRFREIIRKNNINFIDGTLQVWMLGPKILTMPFLDIEKEYLDIIKKVLKK